MVAGVKGDGCGSLYPLDQCVCLKSCTTIILSHFAQVLGRKTQPSQSQHRACSGRSPNHYQQPLEEKTHPEDPRGSDLASLFAGLLGQVICPSAQPLLGPSMEADSSSGPLPLHYAHQGSQLAPVPELPSNNSCPRGGISSGNKTENCTKTLREAKVGGLLNW